MVSKNPLVDRVLDASSGKEAISLARKYKPNIAILDIELAPKEKLNGIEVAKTIYDFSSETYFIFITAYFEYVLESFVVHPYDYIVKPVDKDKLIENINKLVSLIKKNNGVGGAPERVMLKVKNEFNETVMLSLDNILFIEKQNKLSLVYSTRGINKTYKTLRELEDKLGENFLRVHNSFIVNLDKISRIRDVGNRSYEIDFNGYDQVALMSRYKFKEHKHKFAPL
ncbi:MAG: LytTR family DNA-binding domain-containing protein [Firmicutes bacterium]|nr:LytTR family DNA-binding domain-containing protein [Bacillota bacterium]